MVPCRLRLPQTAEEVSQKVGAAQHTEEGIMVSGHEAFSYFQTSSVDNEKKTDSICVKRQIVRVTRTRGKARATTDDTGHRSPDEFSRSLRKGYADSGIAQNTTLIGAGPIPFLMRLGRSLANSDEEHLLRLG